MFLLGQAFRLKDWIALLDSCLGIWVGPGVARHSQCRLLGRAFAGKPIHEGPRVYEPDTYCWLVRLGLVVPLRMRHTGPADSNVEFMKVVEESLPHELNEEVIWNAEFIYVRCQGKSRWPALR